MGGCPAILHTPASRPVATDDGPRSSPLPVQSCGLAMPRVVEILILVPTGVNVRLPFRLFEEIFDGSLDILSQDIGESRNSRCVDIGIPQERKGQLMTGFVVGHHDHAFSLERQNAARSLRDWSIRAM